MKITRTTRLQSRLNSIVMVLLIVALAGLVGWLSTRHEVQMDWTQSGRHTLSDASVDVLNKLEGPIEITSYSRDNPELREAVKQFVERYQRVKPDIELHFINPDIVPDEVRNLGISIDGEMIVRYRDRTEHVKSDREEEMTNALQRLARGEENWLAFVEGHGERSALGEANHDVSLWVEQLKSRGFKIQPLNLASVNAIPENTRLLVIASPDVDYLPGEVELILEYVRSGGNLLWFNDPGSLHGLDALADTLHIKKEPGMMIDFAGSLIGIDDPSIVLMTTSLYPPHPITRDFDYTTFFPTATALKVEENDTWDSKPFLSSGDHTWVEKGPLQGEVNFDAQTEEHGPLDLGVGLEREVEQDDGDELVTLKQRIAVITDGDFISNAYVNSSGNLDLGIRLINWLSSKDDFISIPARVANDTQLELSPLASGIIGFGFLIILPLFLMMTGLAIWWRRKKQ